MTDTADFFRARLDDIVDRNHPLVGKLGAGLHF
jgi:hypothetical protein